MYEEFKQIYDLLYSPIVTPYNLLENVKLPNYVYVNYYKGEEGIISEMKCFMDEEETIFYYCFDQDDRLSKIFMSQGEVQKKLVFERGIELEIALDAYYEKRNDGVCREAV